MHRAWLVDDIVELIIDRFIAHDHDDDGDRLVSISGRYFFDRVSDKERERSCISLMCTSKRLFHLVARKYWSHTTLERLLRLAWVCMEDYDDECWTRIEVYTSMIQALDLAEEEWSGCDSEGTIYVPQPVMTCANLFDALQHCPIDPVLPALRRLTSVLITDDGSYVDLAVKFINPDLREIIVEPPSNYGRLDRRTFLLRYPTLQNKVTGFWTAMQRVKHLQRLQLDLAPISETVDQLLMDALVSFETLRHLEITHADPTPAMMLAVTSLHQLGTLKISTAWSSKHTNPPATSHQSFEGPARFPNMVAFTWEQNRVELASSLLSGMSRLEDLKLRFLDNGRVEIQTIMRLAALASASELTLRSLQIIGGTGGPFPQQAIEGLLRCKKIESLELFARPRGAWLFADNQIQSMPQGWPGLRSFVCRHWSENAVSLASSHPSIAVLRAFSDNCPLIRELKITVQPPDRSLPILNRPPVEGTLAHELQLELGNRVGRESLGLALFLAQLWPDRKLTVYGSYEAATFYHEVNDLLEFPRHTLIDHYAQQQYKL